MQRRDGRFSGVRLACFLAVVACLSAAFWLPLRPAWALLPAAAFVAAVVPHDRVLRRLADVRRRQVYVEAGIARLAGRRPPDAPLGPPPADLAAHPYACDLDLFGADGIYGLLCTAQTASGQRRLASMLLQSPDVASLPLLQARQSQVRALRGAWRLREDLAALGQQLHAVVHDDALAAWAEAPAAVAAPDWFRQLRLCHASMLVGVGIGLMTHVWLPLLAAATWQAWVGRRFARAQGVQPIGEGLEAPRRELPALAQIVARLQRPAAGEGEGEADALTAPLGPLRSHGAVGASAAIDRLERLGQALDWRKNQLLAPLAWLVMWEPHLALQVENWRLRFGPQVRGWLQAVGECEALLSLAGYAFEHPEDVFPDLVAGEVAAGGPTPVLAGEQMRHPLLPRATAVAHDVHLQAEARLLIVSGSNKSGKSTLVRTVGLQAVLAFCGLPVPARSLRLSPLQVGATLRIQDSLQGGKSRFFAELERLRQLKEASTHGAPLLFLLDEILHGTNSADRAVGAEALLHSLLASGAIGLVTTHDLSLSRCAEGLRARNVHFADDWVDQALRFDYKMRPGVVQKSNALALMQQAGLL